MAARPPQHGSLRRAFNVVTDWVMGKKVVGRDAAGNVYYRWYEGSGEERLERREVQWSTAYMFYDPNDIPSEWRMWLRKQRDEPPSEEEMRQNAAKKAALAARVAVLDEAERLRRLRQQTVGMPDQHAGAQPDMARFLQQMGSGGRGAATGPAPGGGGTPGPSSGTPGGGDFKPDTWRPGSSS
ncbi:hypothetical protein GPECTOR_8g310 [Gonium pectorale]|uniref:Uncharacterized protein n=1 Tax=Gonium pectorale TaxID=33097 RepID=A0A150GSV5_GONPE|nr:hypothetical protein GPECTOR_8g310 [Gonium pectorale]|eukprot:KXZ52935.1 hypothetical protein GPECTOR_8g310 [Gonium pectorale]